jgi:hypothetical protein
MTNKEVADAAGVSEFMVRKYRERREQIEDLDLPRQFRVDKAGRRLH